MGLFLKNRLYKHSDKGITFKMLFMGEEGPLYIKPRFYFKCYI